MPRLPNFIRGRSIDYFGKKRINRDAALFIEDLNFWLDKVFLYQRNKTVREAERFMRKLSEGINGELGNIIGERLSDCNDDRKQREKLS